MRYSFKLFPGLFLSCVGLSGSVFSQAGKDIKNAQVIPVKVTDWGANTIMFSEDFWDVAKVHIVEQIGEAEFEKVKANSGIQNLPNQMASFDGRSRKDTGELYPKLNKLQLFKIAAFANTGYKGGDFFILRYTYEGNENWDQTAKWDTVYFIIHEDAVQLKNPSKRDQH